MNVHDGKPRRPEAFAQFRVFRVDRDARLRHEYVHILSGRGDAGHAVAHDGQPSPEQRRGDERKLTAGSRVAVAAAAAHDGAVGVRVDVDIERSVDLCRAEHGNIQRVDRRAPAAGAGVLLRRYFAVAGIFADGAYCLQIEALHIQQVGETDVVVHMKGIGNKEYKNITKDTLIGTTGQNRRLEAIRITGKESFYLYRVHQKSIGWSEWANNGEWAGTSGKGLQMEALEIKKSMFSVEPHVQSKGWVDYGMITKDTIIGTVGEKKRIECLCFEGDFEYRVHIQNSGWTDWTRADGVATLGTVGQELRIEAIQFR